MSHAITYNADGRINDFYNSTSQPATPAQYLANLQTAISNIRAKLVGQVPPIIIMRQYERGPTGSTLSLPYQWATYSAAIDQLIAADPSLLLYDFQAWMPPGVQTSALGLINVIDQTDTGGGYLADDFVSFLVGS